jgi:hypothetical protein
MKKQTKKYKSVLEMIDDISKSESFKNKFRKIIFRKEMIEKITDEIEEYTKPVNYNISCKGCRKGLAESVYQLIEKEFKNAKT